jgi:hypothetical protein
MSLEDCASFAFPETEEESKIGEEARKVNKERNRSPLRAELDFEKSRIQKGGGGISRVDQRDDVVFTKLS